MAGRIPASFIDSLLSQVDVVDVIHARVKLKKQGREYSACCPFHNEKTPSFTVSQKKQFYHCFGCGMHGNAIGFLMDYEHLSYVEAIESLAAAHGLTVPRESGGYQPTPQQKQAQLTALKAMTKVREIYIEQLKQSAEATQYIEQRGLSAEILERYGVGYAIDAWDSIAGRYQTPQQQQILLACGVCIKSDNGRVYDRYRNRVIFPIRNRKGDCIGFGGRVINPEDKPKYINSPETEQFHKSHELYGFYEMRQHNRELSRIVVVEGYMDVIALAQFGVGYAVATMGTATTEHHIKTCLRTVDELVFCFDGDRAGYDAAWKAVAACLPQMRDGKSIRFVFLPDGEDPDSYIRAHGQAGFEQAMDQASSLFSLFFETINKKHNLSNQEGRVAFVKEAAHFVGAMPESLLKDQFIAQTCKLGNIELQDYNKHYSGNSGTVDDKKPVSHFQNTQLNGEKGALEVRKTPIRHAIFLLLHYPKLALQVTDIESLSKADTGGIDALLEALEMLQLHPDIDGVALLERFRESEHYPALVQLYQSPLDVEEGIAAKEFDDCLALIIKERNTQLIEALLHKEQNQGLDGFEKQDLLALLARQ